MTFKTLRTGSTLYVFHKDNAPRLEVGQLASDPEIRQKHPIAPPQGVMGSYPSYMPQTTEQVVDLSAKIAEKTIPIKGLNPMADIEDCGGGVFVSCSRDAINAEIAAYKHISDLALSEETLGVHRTISGNCSEIMARLNPEIAERQRMEQENQDLKKEIKDMKSMLDSIMKGLENKKPKNYGNDNQN